MDEVHVVYTTIFDVLLHPYFYYYHPGRIITTKDFAGRSAKASLLAYATMINLFSILFSMYD